MNLINVESQVNDLEQEMEIALNNLVDHDRKIGQLEDGANRKQQRFEAAKAAMQGILSNQGYSSSSSSDITAMAIMCADALLAALEEG